MTGGWNIQWPSSMQAVLSSIGLNMPAVVAMATALAYVIGFWFFFRALYKLRAYGELRTMMSAHTQIFEPILLLLAGTFMLFLPTIITVTETTFFGHYTPTPISYKPVTPNERWQALLEITMIIFRVVGLIAFIRGIMMLPKIHGQGGPQVGLGKCITHIVGGALLINIHTTVSVIANTFGATVST